MKVDLFYQDSRSDKEYHLEMKYHPSTGYQVLAQFGPRGGTLTHVDLGRGKSLTYSQALAIYQKREKEKRAKGYTDIHSKIINRLMTLTGWPYGYLLDYQWKRLEEAVEAIIEEEV